MWNSNESLFGTKDVRFFAFARAALLCGLKMLEIEPGDNVLLPSYICDSVPGPFHYLGIGIRYYPVRENLGVDLKDLEERINTRTRALLVVNYFGFPQDYFAIRGFCEENRLFLVEDNAHGFLSRVGGKLLGKFGDISICSFRKHLVIPSGATLVVNEPSLANRLCGFLLSRHRYREWSETVKSVVKAWDLKLSLGLVRKRVERSRSRDAGKCNQSPSTIHSEETNVQDYLQACPAYSKYVIRRLNIRAFVNCLRARYRAALEHIRRQGDMEPIFPSLPEGVVPRAVPGISSDCESCVQRLREKGIYATTWPRLPQAVRNDPARFPAFYRRIVIVPLAGQELLLGVDPRKLAV